MERPMDAKTDERGPLAVSPIGRVAAPVKEQVLNAIRDAILDFRLKPGERLIEREIIEQMGVSRATVREAISVLASEGLVTIVPQKGARVTAPTPEDAADLYEIRASLESMVVRRFVDRASDAEVEHLAATVEHMADRLAEPPTRVSRRASVCCASRPCRPPTVSPRSSRRCARSRRPSPPGAPTAPPAS
jgi:DNA-binding transcriptional regulator YhcF (GntR family)